VQLTVRVSNSVQQNPTRSEARYPGHPSTLSIIQSDGSLQCSKQHATGHYSQPAESSLHPHTHLLTYNSVSPSHSRVSVPEASVIKVTHLTLSTHCKYLPSAVHTTSFEFITLVISDEIMNFLVTQYLLSCYLITFPSRIQPLASSSRMGGGR
jgi:hypothetical protein